MVQAARWPGHFSGRNVRDIRRRENARERPVRAGSGHSTVQNRPPITESDHLIGATGPCASVIGCLEPTSSGHPIVRN